MTVLVTGGTGNIGRQVVQQLQAAGADGIRVMTRTPGLVADGVEFVYGDFARPESWEAALKGVDRVHLFPFASEGFVRQAAKRGVRRFVVHSAAAAGFEPVVEPVDELQKHLEDERQAHRAVEQLVEETGAEWTHVRPGLLAVNTLTWAPAVKAGQPVRAPYGIAGHPLVHEADVAEIAVRALLTDDHLGQAHTITGPEKVSQIEQVRAIGDAIGRAVPFEEVTPEQGLDQWRSEGYPEEYLPGRLAVLEDALEGTGSLPPSSTFEELTGRPPKPFAAWAVDHAADFTGR